MTQQWHGREAWAFDDYYFGRVIGNGLFNGEDIKERRLDVRSVRAGLAIHYYINN